MTTPSGEPEVELPRVWAGPSLWRLARESGVFGLLLVCTLVTVVTTAGIVGVLGFEALRFFQKSGIGLVSFLTGSEQDFVSIPPKFGALPLVWGTFLIASGSSIIALPIGLLSAISLSEYAPRWVRAVLKPALELLAGIPTIVYGYLALVLVTPLLKAMLEPWGIQVDTYNALSGAIVVGIMIIPMVSSLSEDVLSSVPRSLREAAYGLGATKFEVSTRVVLPAGLSGVMASFILAVSRAIGETMAVVLAAGQLPQIDPNPLRSIQTMTAYIVQVIGGEASYDSPEYLSLFAVGATLFVITLAMNVASGLVLRRFREAYE
jgi:phosphate transport system permease protein